MRDPSVLVLAARGPDGVRAGAVAHRSGPVVGVSSVFTTSLAADEAWAGLVAALVARFPGLPLVGYEGGPDLAPALGCGFVVTGPLRVWVRPEEALPPPGGRPAGR